MEPLVTISILSYNRLSDLNVTFRALEDIKYTRLEILILDNASTDGSCDFIKNYKFKNKNWIYNFILSPINLGIAGGRNEILKYSHGDFILTIDDDSYPEPYAISNAVRWMSRNNNLGAIACNIVPLDIKLAKVDEQDYICTPDHELFTGSGAFIRACAIKFRFDSNFKFSCEDTDLGLHILRYGWNITTAENVVIRHAYSPLNRSYNHKMQKFAEGYIRLIYKWYPTRHLISAMCKYIILSIKYGWKHKTLTYLKAMMFTVDNRNPLDSYIFNKLLLPFECLFGYWKLPDVKYEDKEILHSNVIIVKTVGTIPTFKLITKLQDMYNNVFLLSHSRSSKFFKGIDKLNIICYNDNNTFEKLEFFDNMIYDILYGVYTPIIIIPMMSNDISSVSNVTKMFKGFKIYYYDISEEKYIIN